MTQDHPSFVLEEQVHPRARWRLTRGPTPDLAQVRRHADRIAAGAEPTRGDGVGIKLRIRVDGTDRVLMTLQCHGNPDKVLGTEMNQPVQPPPDLSAMSRALRAYERLDVHVAICLECDGGVGCVAAGQLRMMAQSARWAAQDDRLWTGEQLGLNEHNRPAVLLPGPLADA